MLSLPGQKNSMIIQVFCFSAIRNDLVFFGCRSGEICKYNPISNQIIFKSNFHKGEINRLIKSGDNKLISCSGCKALSVYKHNEAEK